MLRAFFDLLEKVLDKCCMLEYNEASCVRENKFLVTQLVRHNIVYEY